MITQFLTEAMSMTQKELTISDCRTALFKGFKLYNQLQEDAKTTININEPLK